MLQYIFTRICIHWCSSIYQWVVTRKTFAKDQLRCTSKYHLHPGDLGSIYVRYIYIYIILYVGTNMHICKLYIYMYNLIYIYICIYIMVCVNPALFSLHVVCYCGPCTSGMISPLGESALTLSWLQ